MILRIRYEQQGGHFHLRVFTARGPNQTFANCGSLCFDEAEWPQVKSMLLRSGAEVIEEAAP